MLNVFFYEQVSNDTPEVIERLRTASPGGGQAQLGTGLAQVCSWSTGNRDSHFPFHPVLELQRLLAPPVSLPHSHLHTILEEGTGALEPGDPGMKPSSSIQIELWD